MSDFKGDKPLHHDPQINRMLVKLKEKDEMIKVKFDKFEKKIGKYGDAGDKNGYLSPRMNELHSNLVSQSSTAVNFRKSIQSIQNQAALNLTNSEEVSPY